MAYISVAVEVDPATITQEKLDSLQTRVPGLTVLPGQPLYFLLEVTSERDAINAQLLTDVTDLIWDTFGAQIVRIPRVLALQATGVSTWTRVNTPENPLASPLTVPAGTGLSLAGLDGNRVPFQTRNAVTFLAGAASTAVGEVELIAVTGGNDGNDLQGDPQTNETLLWLDTITVLAPTTGGTDEEDVDVYRSRLGDQVSNLAKTLVQAPDFEREARSLTGVARALALDLYTPGPPADPAAAGHITVAVVDSAGADPGSTVRGQVLADLQANAISVLQVHVIAPTYTTLTVVFAAKSDPGYDPADVEARAEQAVLDFLDPARWGLPARGDQPVWIDSPIVYFQDVVTVLNGVEGLDRYTSLTVNGGTADVTMTSPAALPAPASTTTATGTVTAP